MCDAIMKQLSRLDAVYRSILLSKYFIKGWGKPENLKRLFEFRKVISNREKCKNLVSSDYPVIIDKVEEHSTYKILEGHLISPFVQYLPEVVPKESHIAWFQVILPKKWHSDQLRPICIQLAGTGDHHFWRRRTLSAKPLLKESGVASILLENPFYGLRKPKDQVRSNLHCVSDIFVMGGCLVLESLALLHWCEREGFGPLGIHGISMGGHMASIAGTNWHKPLGIIPCLSWTTASCVFTQGVMSGAIPWDLLKSQYFSDHVYGAEIEQMIHSPEENVAFKAGQQFARNYPASMHEMQKLNEQLQKDISIKKDQRVKEAQSQVSETESTSSEPRTTTSAKDLIITDAKASKAKNYYNSLLESLTFDVRTMAVVDDKSVPKQVLNFMRGIMDECTHLENFFCPVDPSLAIIVAATKDAYVLREGLKSLQSLWPGSDVRYIDAGHVSAFLFSQHVFRKAIVDSLEKTSLKYYGKSILKKEEEEKPAAKTISFSNLINRTSNKTTKEV